MKRIVNVDGSVDRVFSREEFERLYLVGCLIKLTRRKATVRVVGEVNNLKNVVIRRYERS